MFPIILLYLLHNACFKCIFLFFSFQSIGSCCLTIGSQPGCQAATSKFCTIIINSASICLLFVKVSRLPHNSTTIKKWSEPLQLCDAMSLCTTTLVVLFSFLCQEILSSFRSHWFYPRFYVFLLVCIDIVFNIMPSIFFSLIVRDQNQFNYCCLMHLM